MNEQTKGQPLKETEGDALEKALAEVLSPLPYLELYMSIKEMGGEKPPKLDTKDVIAAKSAVDALQAGKPDTTELSQAKDVFAQSLYDSEINSYKTFYAEEAKQQKKLADASPLSKRLGISINNGPSFKIAQVEKKFAGRQDPNKIPYLTQKYDIDPLKNSPLAVIKKLAPSIPQSYLDSIGKFDYQNVTHTDKQLTGFFEKSINKLHQQFNAGFDLDLPEFKFPVAEVPAPTAPEQTPFKPSPEPAPTPEITPTPLVEANPVPTALYEKAAGQPSQLMPDFMESKKIAIAKSSNLTSHAIAEVPSLKDASVAQAVEAIRDRVNHAPKYFAADSHDDLHDWLEKQKVEPPEKSLYPRGADGQVDDLTLMRTLDFQADIQDKNFNAPIAYWKKAEAPTPPTPEPASSPAIETPKIVNDPAINTQIKAMVGKMGESEAIMNLVIKNPAITENADFNLHIKQIQDLPDDAPTAQYLKAYTDLKNDIRLHSGGTDLLSASPEFTAMDAEIAKIFIVEPKPEPTPTPSPAPNPTPTSDSPSEYPENPSPEPDKPKKRTAVIAGFDAIDPKATQRTYERVENDEPIPGLWEGYLRVAKTDKASFGGGNWLSRMAQASKEYFADVGDRWKNGKETRIGRIVGRQWFKNVFLFNTRSQLQKELEATGVYTANESLTVARDRVEKRYWQEMTEDQRKAERAKVATGLVGKATKDIPLFGKTSANQKAINGLVVTELSTMAEKGEIAEINVQRVNQKAIANRFSQDASTWADMIHTGAGEQVKVLDEMFGEGNVAKDYFKNDLAKVFQDYITASEYPDERLSNEVAALLNKYLPYKAEDVDFVKKLTHSEFFASSFKDLADYYKGNLDHAASVESIRADLEQVEIRLGLASAGERTDVEKVAGEEFLSWFEKKGVNPVTATTAVSLALGSLDLLTNSPFSAALRRGTNGTFSAFFRTMPLAPIIGAPTAAPLVAGMATSALFSGVKNWVETKKKSQIEFYKRETETVAPETAKAFISGSDLQFFDKIAKEIPRRKAADLISDLRDFYEDPASATSPFKTLTTEQVEGAIAALSTAKAYITVSDNQIALKGGIGLITYDGSSQLEIQRGQLDLAVARLRADLTKQLGTDVSKTHGLAPERYINALSETKTWLIEQTKPKASLSPEAQVLLAKGKGTEVSAKSLKNAKKAINNAIGWRAAVKGAKSAGFAALIGETVLETSHAIQGSTGEMVSEAWTHGQVTPRANMTPLQSILANIWKTPDSQVDAFAPPLVHGFEYGESLIRIPVGSTLTDTDGDGTFDLTLPDHKTVITGFADEHGQILYKDTPWDQYHLKITSNEANVAIGDAHPVTLNSGETITLPGDNWQYDKDTNAISVVIDPNNQHFETTEIFKLDDNGHFQLKDIKELSELGIGVTGQPTPMAAAVEFDLPGNTTHLEVFTPEHTHLVLDKDHPGIYDLVDDKGTTLVDDIHIGVNGGALNEDELEAQLAAHHLTLDSHEASLTPGTETVTSGTVDVRAGNLDPTGPDGGGGWWNYYRNLLKAQTGKEPSNAEVNTLYKLLRGYDQNDVNGGLGSHIDSAEPGTEAYHRIVHTIKTWDGKESLVSAPQSENMYYDDVPKVLYTENAAKLAELAHLTTSAVDKLGQGDTFESLSPEEQIAYTIGYIGGEKQVPDEEDVKTLLKFLGSSATATDGAFTPASLTISQVSQTIDWGDPHSYPIAETAISWDPDGSWWDAHGWDIWPVAIPAPFEHQEQKANPVKSKKPIPPPKPYNKLDSSKYPEQDWWNLKGDGQIEEYLKWLDQTHQKNIQYEPYARTTDGKVVYADGKEISRNIDREKQRINAYLDRQKQSYREELEKLSDGLSPMDKDCRVSVILPMYHEEKGAYHTLELWKNQTADHSKYEVNVLVNREQHSYKDNTAEEVQRFISDNPGFKVNFMDLTFPTGQGGVVVARKYISDVSLVRSQRRTEQSGPLYFASEDADMVDIDKAAIEKIITKFDENPQFDALKGKQYHDIETIKENEYVLLERMGGYVREQMLRQKDLLPENNPKYDWFWNSIITGGWNTSLTAEGYAMIDGYNLSLPGLGEDIDMGRKLSIIRSSTKRNDHIIPNTDIVGTLPTKHISSPRRWLHAIWKGQQAYDTYTNDEVDKVVKNLPVPEMLKKIENISRLTEDNKTTFASVFNFSRGEFYRMSPSSEIAEKMFDRYAMLLGLGKHKITTLENGDTKITSTNDLSVPGDEWHSDYHINENGDFVLDNIHNLANALKLRREGNQSSKLWTLESTIASNKSKEEPPLPPPPVPDEVKNTVMDPDFSIDFGNDPKFKDLTEVEKIDQIIHDNKTFGLNYFIKTARQHLKQTSTNNEWRTQSAETKWLTNNEIRDIAQKYGVSMAFTFIGRHARVLTKPPIAKGGGVYAVTVYDPFHDGEQTIDITPNPKDADTFIFTTNDLTVDGSSAGSSTYDFEDVIKRLQKTNYDLSIPIITGREYLAQAKQGALQTDGHNCTLWSLFYAAMANAMKPGFNTFKGVGLEKWQRDFGFTLRTYESVTGKPPLAIKLGEPA